MVLLSGPLRALYLTASSLVSETYMPMCPIRVAVNDIKGYERKPARAGRSH